MEGPALTSPRFCRALCWISWPFIIHTAIVIVLLSGIIGGLLTGLALYTGKALVAERSINI